MLSKKSKIFRGQDKNWRKHYVAVKFGLGNKEESEVGWGENMATTQSGNQIYAKAQGEDCPS